MSRSVYALPVLATPLSRIHWLASHLVVVMIGSVVMMLAAGIGFGLSGASSTGDTALIGTLVGAALAYLPALWIIAGGAVVLFGLWPRATALAWIVPLYSFLVSYLGQLLQFPNWTNNLSPFGHIPQLPWPSASGRSTSPDPVHEGRLSVRWVWKR